MANDISLLNLIGQGLINKDAFTENDVQRIVEFAEQMSYVRSLAADKITDLWPYIQAVAAEYKEKICKKEQKAGFDTSNYPEMCKKYPEYAIYEGIVKDQNFIIYNFFKYNMDEYPKEEALRFIKAGENDTYFRILQKARKKRKASGESVYVSKTSTNKDLSSVPDKYAIITLPGFENGVSFNQAGDAFMMESNQQYEISVNENGRVSIGDIDTESFITNAFNKNGEVSNINLPFLNILYTIMLKKATENFSELYTSLPLEEREDAIEKFEIPDAIYIDTDELLRKTGRLKTTTDNINSLKRDLKSFDGLYGCFGGHPEYKVLAYMSMDDDQVIEIRAPYFKKLIKKIIKKSIPYKKDGKIRINRSGKINLLPAHNFDLSATNAKERNSHAILIVHRIARLLSEVGKDNKYVPNISAQTLLNDIPEIKARYEGYSETKHKDRYLSNLFSAAWKILKENYKDDERIKIPDVIPTTKTLNHVFEFKSKPEQ